MTGEFCLADARSLAFFDNDDNIVNIVSMYADIIIIMMIIIMHNNNKTHYVDSSILTQIVFIVHIYVVIVI